ncbi:snare-domain-containing protein [Cystobasidium minutum MCA 4210]|uniref:snare-domain-containing protein n=1 Tax=Cystobasidium minutum MCA 4210 TaxID=1397322 RepID=UPI0034CDA0A5|eukprot:jgi/Rhomi1/80561/CE80560_533
MNLQGIYVRSHQERSQPDKHVAYAVEVHSPNRTWTVWRRYSEFEALLKDIENELVVTATEKGKERASSASSSKLPELPPKRASLGSAFIKPWKGLTGKGDEQFIKDRQHGLETFLRAILGSREAHGQAARESRAFRSFLEIPVSTSMSGPGSSNQKGGASAFTSQSWLEEYHALEAVCRDIQSSLSKRDGLADRGDSTAAHQSNVQAKKQLAALVNRMSSLAVSLDDEALRNTLSEGELRRRTDMVAKLQDRAEVLRNLSASTSTAAGMEKRYGTTSSASTTEARQKLLATGSSGKPVTRVLGARKPAEETEQTRVLDNGGLLQLQMQQMDEQDDRVSSLTAIVRRQRQLATAINVELVEQNELLDRLSEDVDNTETKLSGAKKQLKKLGS